MKPGYKALIQSTALLLSSLAIAATFCEGMARVYTKLNAVEAVGKDSGLEQTALLDKYFDIATVASALKFEQPLATRYVEGIKVAAGVDRRWFEDVPFAPDRNPRDVDPRDLALQKEYVRRGHYGPHSFYLWNKKFAESLVCDKRDEIFKNLPQAINVFEPPDGSPFPRFRFPPSRTLPSGLKTNRYGFRGPDFDPKKLGDAIRIAFIGSSQTIGNHSYPFSYPEYFGIWLNRWLKENGYQLRAEIINAGEEGIGTTDVAAILEQSILPLNPDYIIFYDGANQLLGAQSLISPPVAIDRSVPSAGPRGRNSFLFAHSQLVRTSGQAYNLYLAHYVENWTRPRFQFAFPTGVDEGNPKIDSENLPVGLPVFVRDLDRMASAAHKSGIPFFISTPDWLDGSELSRVGSADQRAIAASLKSQFWPLEPSQIRRLIDFANRTYRQVAKSKGVGLLEIADQFPRDPALHTDAYHLTPEGLKLLAWIALQGFLPTLEQDLRTRSVPKPAPSTSSFPKLEVSKFAPNCSPSSQALASARVLSLPTVKIGSDEGTVKIDSTGVNFASAPVPWAYIARAPLNDSCVSGGGWLSAKILVGKGTVGIGVLNLKGDNFVVSTPIYSSPEVQTVNLMVESFASTGDFVLRNWEDKVPANGKLLELKIATSDGRAPEPCAFSR